MNKISQLIAFASVTNLPTPHLPSTLLSWTDGNIKMLSDPFEDYNILHYALDGLTKEQRDTYWNYLYFVVTGRTPNEYLMIFGKLEVTKLLFPTRENIIEAFLKTMCVWES